MHRTARPHETLYEDQERTRRHIMVFRQGSILGPHHLPRITNEDALARTFWTWELSTLERASNAIAATSLWRDFLFPFCFAANLASAQVIRQSGCAANSSRTSFCFGWRNAEATFHLYISTRNLHAPLANVKQLQATIPRGCHRHPTSTSFISGPSVYLMPLYNQ